MNGSLRKFSRRRIAVVYDIGGTSRRSCGIMDEQRKGKANFCIDGEESQAFVEGGETYSTSTFILVLRQM